MPEFELPDADRPTIDVAPPTPPVRPADELDAYEVGERGPASREGLPPTYRMRADRHYIDHMTSESVGLPVRLLPVGQLDAPPAAFGEALAQSIARHGLLQPLLVRKRDGRYQVIAGRKRLAAAVTAGLTAVPCLLHSVGDAEAAAIAEADNIRGGSPQMPESVGRVEMRDVLNHVATDLARLDRSAALLHEASSAFAYHRTVVDLIAAQAWRTAWLARAAAFVAGQRRPTGRVRAVTSIIERVTHGFAPDLRLSGVRLRTAITTPSEVAVDETVGELTLTGAMLATLSLLQAEEDSILELRAGAPESRAVVVDVVQHRVPIAHQWARDFADTSAPAQGKSLIGLVASLIRAVSAQDQASVELVQDHQPGSLLRCSLPIE